MLSLMKFTLMLSLMLSSMLSLMTLKLHLTEDRAPFAQHFFFVELDELNRTHTHDNILHSITRKADYIGMCNLKY